MADNQLLNRVVPSFIKPLCSRRYKFGALFPDGYWGYVAKLRYQSVISKLCRYGYCNATGIVWQQRRI